MILLVYLIYYNIMSELIEHIGAQTISGEPRQLCYLLKILTRHILGSAIYIVIYVQ